MFGLLFAVLCAAGIYRIWRPRRYWRGGFGPPAWAWGGGGCGPWGGGPFRHGGPRSARLDWLVRDLNANPEQEAALRQSAEELRQAFGSLDPKGRLDAVSAALTADTFDRDQLRNQIHEAKAGPVADAVVNSVERLRASLSADQRKKIATMISGGGWGCGRTSK